MDFQTTGNTLVVTNGDLVICDNLDAIIQDVSRRLKFFLGEWFLNTKAGIPYFQEILGKHKPDGYVASLFRQVVMETPGIQALTQDVTLTYIESNRYMTVAFKANTTSGPLTYTKDLVLP
jgi:hypothetical protein